MEFRALPRQALNRARLDEGALQLLRDVCTLAKEQAQQQSGILGIIVGSDPLRPVLPKAEHRGQQGVAPLGLQYYQPIVGK